MNKNNNTSVFQLSTYTSPEISEANNRDWVDWVTQDGEDYFTYLIDRYNGSATNNAIITAISELIYGKGVAATNSNEQVSAWMWLSTTIKKDTLRRVAHDLKLFNKFALEVIWAKSGDKITEVNHLPVDKIRAEQCNNEGIIEHYYYAWDWELVAQKKAEAVKIKSFDEENKTGKQILYINPYNSGYFYYSPVDYQGGVQYAQLEEEIGNYHINNIMNGLAPSFMINFNNGVPESEEERKIIENRIMAKWSGSSNAGRGIVSFNDNAESAATIETIQLSDAHNQYQFLSDECMRKLLVSHRVTSPMLLGIKDQTGLGNNAEELKTASTLFDNTVIIPKQEIILEALDRILNAQGFSLDLYFKTLQPLEFIEQGNVAVDKDTREKETGIQMSAAKGAKPFLNDDTADAILKSLEGVGELEADILSEYELEDAQEVTDEAAEYDVESYLNSRTDLAGATPEQDSELDGERYKVRYVYTKGTSKTPKGETRKLCSALLSAGRVYRKEDIENLSSSGGAEAKGQPYDVFLYKGGANCYHRWERRIYRKKLKKDGEVWGGGALSGTKKVSVNQAVREGFKLPSKEQQPKEVAIAPIDTPTKGYKK